MSPQSPNEVTGTSLQCFLEVNGEVTGTSIRHRCYVTMDLILISMRHLIEVAFMTLNRYHSYVPAMSPGSSNEVTGTSQLCPLEVHGEVTGTSIRHRCYVAMDLILISIRHLIEVIFIP